MIRINLLPFRAARKKENIRRDITLFLLIISVVVVILGYYHYSLKKRIDELNTDINHVKVEVETFNKKVKELDGINEKLVQLNQKIDVIKSLDNNRRAPVVFLDNLTSMIIPERMWISQLKDIGQKVDFFGEAFDNKTVADFMTNLQKSKFFSNVKLFKIENKDYAKKSIKLKKFHIIGEKIQAKKPDEKGKKKARAK